MATETNEVSQLRATSKIVPTNSLSVGHATALGIENSAPAQALVGNGTPPAAAPSQPVEDSSVVSMTGTMAQYASQYGLLAGGIVAAVIIGTVIVKKLIKRKK